MRFCLLLGATLLVGIVGCGSPPSDEDLVSEFRSRRADYEALTVMFRADSGLGRVAESFTRPANFFSGAKLPRAAPVGPDRLVAYRHLFRRLSLDAGVEGYDRKRVIYFWRYTEGMGAGLGGASKGIAWSDSLQPGRPAAEGCATPSDDCWQFRPIGGPWFILEERNN
jgi:hypothetical protein